MARRVTSKNKSRIRLVFMAITILLVLLAFRLAWIQIVRAEDYTNKAIAQQMSDLPVEADRGSIYDCNGKELATSVKCYTAWVRPQQLANNNSDSKIDDISQKLAVILDRDAKEVKKDLQSDSTLKRLGRYLDKDQCDKIKALDIIGLEVSESTRRYYPLATSAAQLLGSVSEEGVGRTGIEAQFDNYLSGVSGRWIKETDLNGDTLAYGSRKYYKAQDGYNLTLTINEVLQHYAEAAVEKAMKKYKCKKMTCLVMDPKTGDILAMVTNPAFDPNDATEPVSESARKTFEKMTDKQQSEYLSRMWSNPNISDMYEPGSTFKLITTSAALEDGAAKPDDKFYDPGYIMVAGTALHCWNAGGHGSQTLTEAVGNSCNVVQVQLAQKMGFDTLYKYYEMFGITEKTDVSLPAEGDSIIKKKADLTKVDLATMAYGQGIALTPIQLLTAVCAIGNDGVLMQPRIVKEMTDSSGKVVKTFDTKVVRKVISSKTAEEMKDIMQFVVDEGGGHNAQVTGYRVGGKTGTSDKPKNGGYSKDTWSSFLGMAPLDDPQLAILVIGDSPKGSQYGSTVAAPVAGRFLEKALAYLEVSPQYTEEEKATGEVGVTYVPDVKGMNSVLAAAEIKAAKLKVKISPEPKDNKSFIVKDQYPKAGTKVNKKDTVYIYSE